MEETGKVIEITDNKVKIEITPSGGCANCSQSRICNPFGNNKKIIELENSVNAEIGDMVKIEIKEKTRFVSISIVLGIPIIFFVIGIVIGNKIAGDAMSALLGGLGLLIAFLLVRLINNHWQKTNKEIAVIKEKIKQV